MNYLDMHILSAMYGLIFFTNTDKISGKKKKKER